MNKPKIIRLLLLGLAVVLISSNGLAQSVVTATFGGQEVKLLIPRGYCVIPSDTPEGKPFYDLQVRGQATANNIVGILFADCNEWKKRVADSSYIINRHGNYLLHMTDGQQQLAPLAYPRAKYVKAIAEAAAPSDSKMNEKVNKGIASSKIKSGQVSNLAASTRTVDGNGLYTTMHSSIKYPQEDSPRNIAVASTLTVVKRVPLSLNLYSPYTTAAALQNEAAAERLIVKEFIRLNGDEPSNR